MRLFTPWFPPPGGDPEQPPVMVREGFSPWALLFGGLVLLRRGSWLCATLVLLCSLLAAMLAHQLEGGWVLLAGIHLAVASFAADWRGWELRQGGYVAGPPVSGGDRAQALLRLLDQRPELAGTSRPQGVA